MKTLEQIREAKVGVVMNPKVVGFQVKDAMGKISHSLKHKSGMHHVHVSGNDAKDAHSALKSHPLYVAGKLKVVAKEEVEENFQVQKYANGKKDGPPKSFGGNLKKATAHASKMKNSGAGDHRVHKEEAELEEMNPAKHVAMSKKNPDMFCVCLLYTSDAADE